MALSRFLLTYDVAASAIPVAAVSAFIKNNKFIRQWASPFSGTYLLKSDAEMSDLIECFNDFFGDDYIVARITSTGQNNWNGKISTEIWPWFSLLNFDDEMLKIK